MCTLIKYITGLECPEINTQLSANQIFYKYQVKLFKNRNINSFINHNYQQMTTTTIHDARSSSTSYSYDGGVAFVIRKTECTIPKKIMKNELQEGCQSPFT